jgi:hypothetical protein
MKNLVLLSIGLFLSFTGTSQSCLPQGITFTTQAQIDNFPANFPNCTHVEGAVTINGVDITNLNGLSSVVSIGGALEIIDNNNLTSLAGLNSISSIGGDLFIYENHALVNLEGLYAVSSIGHSLLISRNEALINLTGLGPIQFINYDVDISENTSLTSIAGLDSVTAIGEGLSIWRNPNLSSLTGLGSLTSIGGSFEIFECPVLANLNELQNITAIGGAVSLYSNNNLTSLSGLINLTSIGWELLVLWNYNLVSLSGLDNIEAGSIHGLKIFNNSHLPDCAVNSVCNYLASPAGVVEIHDNATGCNNPAEIESACAAISTDEVAGAAIFSGYPNPASSQVIIVTSVGSTKGQLSIINLHGKELITREVTGSKTRLDISHLGNGVYFIRLTCDETVMVRKLVKQ